MPSLDSDEQASPHRKTEYRKSHFMKVSGNSGSDFRRLNEQSVMLDESITKSELLNKQAMLRRSLV